MRSSWPVERSGWVLGHLVAVLIRRSRVMLALGFGVFYYLALCSFHPLDPSYYSATAPLPGAIVNYGGRFGAEMSAHFWTWLGVVAYVVPVVVGYSVWRCVRHVRSQHSRWEVLSGVLEAPLLMLLFCFFAQAVESGAGHGGWLGYYVRQWTHEQLGVVGSWVVVVAVSGGYVMTFMDEDVWWRWGEWWRGRSAVFFQRIWTRAMACMSRSVGAYVHGMQRVVFRVCEALGYGLRGWWSRGQQSSRKLTGSSGSASDHSLSLGGASESEQRQASMERSQRAERDGPGSLQQLSVWSQEGAQSKTQSIQKSWNPAEEQDEEDGNDGDDEAWVEHNHGWYQEQLHTQPRMDSSSLRSRHRHGDQISRVLEKTLQDFQVQGRMLGYQTGPRVQTFEFEPNSGIKQMKLTSLVDDIARALKVESVIIQPMVGKSALGIQVPRADPQTVYLGDILQPVLGAHARQEQGFFLPIGLGSSPSGEPVNVDLATMPHLLIAGATGSGKSVGIHSLINSIICSRSPRDVKMILVDPKMLELSTYNHMPHLAAPVVTDAHQACVVLEWAVQEMESRYRMMQDVQVRHIEEFNQGWAEMSAQKRRDWQDLYPTMEHLPYLVIIIDELADLMLVAPKDVEGLIQRLAQKARASGIHLVLATQRPSVDVITGVIKANFPARIAFQVVSKHDSRTILDQVGAEKLLGKGDMLFQNPQKIRPERVQGAFVSEKEIRSLVRCLKKDYKVLYVASLERKLVDAEQGQDMPHLQATDAKWQEACEVAQEKGYISASYLQRRLQIGYNRAARMIEMMEAQKLIEGASGVKPRAWIGDRSAS